MAGVIDPMFGSFVFSTAGVYMMGVSYSTPRDVEVTPAANADQAVAPVGKMSGRTINMTCDILGDDATDMRDNFGTFLAAVSDGKQELRIFPDKFFYCQRQGPCELQLMPGTGGYGKFTVSFVAEEPYQFANTGSSARQTLSTSPFQVAVTPTGDAPRIPLHIVITVGAGPITVGSTIKLTNVTTAPYAFWRYVVISQLNAGQQVSVDAESGEVLVAGATEYRNISGVPLWLKGGVVNTIQYDGPVPGGGAATIDINWSDRWF